ncbi:Uncharacterized protein dnm_082070 [Desulfonema magnum]|uniref:Uncharacterized protein n=1 Tax=Desulfonema magnum TaxID=45655 RepID=A0A975BUR9_9BACT|nr:Uncharacterized protein dnm_082070 [Desulfonema magnum]
MLRFIRLNPIHDYLFSNPAQFFSPVDYYFLNRYKQHIRKV